MNLFNKQTLDTCPKHPVLFDLIDQPQYSREASRIGEQLEEEDSSSKININMEDAWIS
jgi:hypothetical protein